MNTFDRELPLIQSARAGNVAARNELIMQWKPLLIKCIMKAVPRGEPEAYLGAAFILCLRFVDLYDPAHGCTFATYMGRHMPSLIRSEVWDEGGAARRPKLRSMKVVKTYAENIRKLKRPASVERGGRDGEPLPLASRKADVDDFLEREKQLIEIEAALATLDPKTAAMVRLRIQGRTHGEIGQGFGLRHGAVSVRLSKAFRKIAELTKAA